jgi:hypothetical protein
MTSKNPHNQTTIKEKGLSNSLALPILCLFWWLEDKEGLTYFQYLNAVKIFKLLK